MMRSLTSIVGLAAIALLAAGCATSGTADSDAEASQMTTPEASVPMPGLGDTALDGSFAFIVYGVECNVARVGAGVAVEEADGQFCVVDLRVSNTGDETRNVYNRNAYIYNRGRVAEEKFPVDLLATLKHDFALTNDVTLEPGYGGRGNLVFDVPRGLVVNEIELHESADSVGVTISLE